ncbi:MAG: hypothetical protein U5J83_17745 [Bryobacterales bacterium]|nr:hypothetical protein [Bryobacterales bacterium]
MQRLGGAHCPIPPHLREVPTGRDGPGTGTIAVARKMVAYLMAVDKRQQPFQLEWEKAA